jgi:nicotinamidase-related amidase
MSHVTLVRNESLPSLDPKTTALLVMDYQVALLGMIGHSESLLSRAGAAIGIARAYGAHIGYVRVAFDHEEYNAVPPYSQFAPFLKAVGSAYHTDSPASAVHGDIAPQPGDVVVRKTRVGAFSTTDLDLRLKERGVVTLLLAGITTSGVVLSTVRDAADRDYQVFVVADASADFEPDVHEFLISKVFPAQAQVVRVADLDRLFSASSRQSPSKQ